jgi:hypothetical protein
MRQFTPWREPCGVPGIATLSGNVCFFGTAGLDNRFVLDDSARRTFDIDVKFRESFVALKVRNCP